MTKAKARQLGKLISRTREGKGWSFRQLGAQSEVPYVWIMKLERGDFASPAPERLARLAEALDIDPERIDRATGGYLSRNLPGMRLYFRAKFSEFSDDDIGRIEKLIARLRREHGGPDGD